MPHLSKHARISSYFLNTVLLFVSIYYYLLLLTKMIACNQYNKSKRRLEKMRTKNVNEKTWRQQLETCYRTIKVFISHPS